MAYVRSFLTATKKGPSLQEGKSLTLNVFGEMQKFDVKEVAYVNSSKNTAITEQEEEESKGEEPTADSTSDVPRQVVVPVVTDQTLVVF